MEKKRIRISFSHSNTLNVMGLHVPADRITSVLNMGETGCDLNIHSTSNHDLLEFIRASQAELTTRGYVKPADEIGPERQFRSPYCFHQGPGTLGCKVCEDKVTDTTRLDEINKANAASGLPPVAMS